MSRKQKEEYHRFFTVSDSRTHEKGYTEYRITARFVSKSRPEDVKEVLVWRRFSELKKLHGELAYTHRNLFRREEEFPHFPPAQVFGRFDEAVIEERRKAAEAMFQFTTTIPALYNSPQLKDFFRGGEVSRPLEPCVEASGTLPPPLIPLPKRRASDCQPAEEEMGREAPTLPQDLGNNLSLELGEPEVAAEALSDMKVSPEDLHSDHELDDRVPSPIRIQDLQEELNSLFDSVVEDQTPHTEEDVQPPLSQNDMATFDPYSKQGDCDECSDHSELFSLVCDSAPTAGAAAYLPAASAELSVALQKEREGAINSAILSYRSAVDILITGVQGDPDPVRREAVMRRTAVYLKHVETLVDTHAAPGDTHT